MAGKSGGVSSAWLLLLLLDMRPEESGGNEEEVMKWQLPMMISKLCFLCCDWTHYVVEFVQLVLVLCQIRSRLPGRVLVRSLFAAQALLVRLVPPEHYLNGEKCECDQCRLTCTETSEPTRLCTYSVWTRRFLCGNIVHLRFLVLSFAWSRHF